MRRTGLATARFALAATLLLVPAAAPAQEEPELIPEEKAPEPVTPAIDTTPPATASGPLRPALDFARWREMTSRERQVFVEGAVQTMTAMTLQLRNDLEVDGRVPHGPLGPRDRDVGPTGRPEKGGHVGADGGNGGTAGFEDARGVHSLSLLVAPSMRDAARAGLASGSRCGTGPYSHARADSTLRTRE